MGRELNIEIELDAAINDVFEKWTTAEGLKSFLAPACNIDIKPGGPYEIFFMPDNPPGMKGADNQMVLAVEAPTMLSFTWNFPPDIPEIREQRTLVVLRLKAQDTGKTKLTLTQYGWGTGADWDRGYDYFKRAWGEVVLPRLQKSFEQQSAWV